MEKTTIFDHYYDYSRMSKKEFESLILIGKPKMRYELVYFILNSLHHITKSNFWYYYCEDLSNEKCRMRIIAMIFCYFENEVERNLFDCNCLFWYYTTLCRELLQLFDEKKVCIECMHGEYVFSGKDWYTEEYWQVPLSKSIQYNEKLQISNLRKQNLPIPVGF